MNGTIEAEKESPMGRHVPLRRCVACRTVQPKSELMRVVRTPEGEIGVDPTGKAAGRGAYVCRRRECVDAAVRKQALPRALGQPLPVQAAQQMMQAAGAPPGPEAGAG
ncbi:MAG TPA: YlxR family protein [Armatimonadota bacterium]|nr:YlxR family protein [Armatimonadota bacterium]